MEALALGNSPEGDLVGFKLQMYPIVNATDRDQSRPLACQLSRIQNFNN